MKSVNKIAISLLAALGIIATAASVHAQQTPMGMGPGMGAGMRGDMAPGMHGGIGNGMMGHGMMNGQMMASNMPGHHAAAQQLMTQDERTAMMEKMKQAKTPEERQKLAQANRAEMEKRAKEKGIELPSMNHDHQMSKPGMGMHGQPG